jgi:hypothetical protein
MWRSRVIHESFEYIPDIQEIILVESFKRPAESGKETVEE